MTAIRATGMSVSEPTLYVGFELSAKEWKLAMTSGFGVAPWIQTVPPGDRGAGAKCGGRKRASWQSGAAAAETGRDPPGESNTQLDHHLGRAPAEAPGR